jgi:hypothetical protein
MRTLKEIILLISHQSNGEKSISITDEESISLLENFKKTSKLIQDDTKLYQEKNVREVEYLYEGRIFNFVFTIDKISGKNDSIIFTSMYFWELCNGSIKIS